jgi:pyridoxine 4-dehydrogenase
MGDPWLRGASTRPGRGTGDQASSDNGGRMNMESYSAAAAGTITIGGDLTVNRLGLGTNRVRDDETSRRALRRAVELGINLIDTADVYTQHMSEQVIGDTLAPYARGVVIATKGGMVVSPSGGHGVDGRPEYLYRAVEESLARLRLDRIDLYFLHRVDPRVPLKESLSALSVLQARGKIGHIGLSAVQVEQIEEARKYIEVVAVENLYSISDRKHEDVLEYCEKERITFVPYYPLRTAKITERTRELEPLLRRYSATPAQLALAWLLKRSPLMLPIPGTLSVKHLEENVAATEIELSVDDVETLERVAT